VLRIGLKQPEQIAVHADGSNLSVNVAPHATETATAIAFLRDDTDPKKPALSTLIPGAAHVVPLVDPAAGDSLFVVPAGLGRATIDLHNYAEFSALPTAAGVVITPLTDDLDMRVTQSRVTVTRPNGLQLTAPSLATADSPAALASTNDGPCFLDLAALGHMAAGNFLDAQRRLRKTLAAMKPDEANRARLTLARFYLANNFAPRDAGPDRADAILRSVACNGDPRLADHARRGRYHDGALQGRPQRHRRPGFRRRPPRRVVARACRCRAGELGQRAQGILDAGDAGAAPLSGGLAGARAHRAGPGRHRDRRIGSADQASRAAARSCPSR
jgi:hypothetical protein